MKRFLWFTCLVAFLLPLQLNAQSVWTSPSHSDGITLEGYKPNFDQAMDDAFGVSAPSSAWFLAGHYSMAPSLRLGAEVGISHFGVDDEIPGFASSETAFGNVLLNAEWITPVENLSASVGVRIPTASDNTGNMTGSLVDIERVAAFAPDTWTVMVDGDYNHALTRDISVRLQGGPLMIVDTAFDDTETDFGARYAAQGWYNAPRFMVGAGLIGITNFSMESTDGIDRTDLAVGGSLIGKLGRYQPGINFQVPVTDNYSNMVDWIVGVSLRLPM